MKLKLLIFLFILILLTTQVKASKPVTYTCCQDFRTSDGVLIEGFNNVSEWQKIGAGTTSSENDTINYREGDVGLKIAAVNGDATNFDKNVSFSISSNTNFDFWMYVKPEDMRNITNFLIILSPTTNYANYYGIQIGSGTSITQNDFIAGWNHYTFNYSDMTKTGSPGTSIVKFRVKITPISGGNVNITLDNFRVNITSRPKVVMVFDDGYANISKYAHPVMSNNNQRGVLGVITELVGLPSYANIDNMTLLYNVGWDIASHTKTHQNLTSVTLENATSEIVNSKSYLNTNGFSRSSNIFIYPSGTYNDYNDAIVDLVKSNYKIGRSYQRGYYQPHFNGSNDGNNTFILRTFSVSNTVTHDTVYSRVNQTINQSGLLILVFHNINNESSSSVSTVYTLLNFTNISNYIASRSADIDVITFNDYLRMTIPDNTAILKNSVIVNSNNSVSSNSNDRINDTTVNLFTYPESGYVIINVTSWETSGTYSKQWIATGSSHNIDTTFVVGDFPSNSNIDVKLDGVSQAILVSNSTGYISFMYTGGYSSHTFNTELASQALATLRSVCTSNANTYGTILQVFSIGIMILALGFIIVQLRGVYEGEVQLHPVSIIFAILISIIGFAMLILGNYLIYAIMGVTGC